MTSPKITTLHLPHLPPTLSIHIALYTSVTNTPHLHTSLLSANPLYAYTFLNASTLLSPTILYAAIFRACNDHLHHRLKTRNIHSEIVFALGTNNNISQALRTFGIGPETRDVVVVKVEGLDGEDGVGGEEVGRRLGAIVQGRAVEWGEEGLRGVRDVGEVRKVYRLPVKGEEGKGKKRRKDGRVEGEGGGGKGRGEEWEMRELEVGILGLMALRGAV